MAYRRISNTLRSHLLGARRSTGEAASSVQAPAENGGGSFGVSIIASPGRLFAVVVAFSLVFAVATTVDVSSVAAAARTHAAAAAASAGHAVCLRGTTALLLPPPPQQPPQGAASLHSLLGSWLGDPESGDAADGAAAGSGASSGGGGDSSGGGKSSSSGGSSGGAITKVAGPRVRLDLFIASMSPASARCVRDLGPTWRRLAPVADVRPLYSQSAARFGRFACPNGDGECDGNRLQLCVLARVPGQRDYEWGRAFLDCARASRLPSYSREMSKECAAKVRACAARRHSIERAKNVQQGSWYWRRGACFSSLLATISPPAALSCVAGDKCMHSRAQVGIPAEARAAIARCFDSKGEARALMLKSAEAAKRHGVEAGAGCAVVVEGGLRCVRNGDKW